MQLYLSGTGSIWSASSFVVIRWAYWLVDASARNDRPSRILGSSSVHDKHTDRKVVLVGIRIGSANGHQDNIGLLREIDQYSFRISPARSRKEPGHRGCTCLGDCNLQIV